MNDAEIHKTKVHTTISERTIVHRDPAHPREMPSIDMPAEGSREEIEHSVHMSVETTRTTITQTGPDDSNLQVDFRTSTPLEPRFEADDRIDHVKKD